MPPGVEQIQEEKSYGSELGENSKNVSQEKPLQQSESGIMDDGEWLNDDNLYDFGKAKMEFFKKRARQILFDGGYEDSENNVGYDGDPLPLKTCYG